MFISHLVLILCLGVFPLAVAVMASSVLPTFADIVKASTRLNGKTIMTPVLSSIKLNEFVGAGEGMVYLKCENMQKSGSFKARGAFNAQLSLSDDKKANGVITFSSGNHALGMSLAAKILGISATIVMPKDAPSVKIEGTRANGANIVFYDREAGEDREAAAAKIMKEKPGLNLIPPYDHFDIICGQGTAAKELFDEVGELDYLFVCTGGAGLLSGSSLAAKALSPNCKVFGVEPEAGNDAQQSMKNGEIFKFTMPPKTIADGAQTQFIGKIPFAVLNEVGNIDILTVTDDQLVGCLQFMGTEMKQVVEPTGCLALAAAKHAGIDLINKRVGIIISGGNVDMSRYAHFLTQQIHVP